MAHDPHQGFWAGETPPPVRHPGELFKGSLTWLVVRRDPSSGELTARCIPVGITSPADLLLVRTPAAAIVDVSAIAARVRAALAEGVPQDPD